MCYEERAGARDGRDADVLLRSSGKRIASRVSPANQTIGALASKTYDDAQLLEISQFDGSLNELNAQYPAECVREENGLYRVSYLGSESVAALLFDGAGNRLLGRVYSAQLQKADFDAISAGQSLDDVLRLDPNGEYLFLFAGRNDLPRVSTHYTKDGYIISVEYDTSNTIISIRESLI